MLDSIDPIRVTAADGTATLWLGFPGARPNRLDAARVAALETAIDAVLANPFLERLVVRSAHPAGFSAGTPPHALRELETDADRRLFAEAGQRVLAKLADAPLVTVAFVEGPCLGSGLELALACDYRLAVARPDSAFGLPDRVCWGGPTRLERLLGKRADQVIGRTVSAKEALALGLVDDAFTARRAKVELQTFLHEKCRRKRRTRWFAPPVAVGLAAERMAFAADVERGRLELEATADRIEPHPLPAVVGLVGADSRTAALAGELALRRVRVLVAAGDGALPDPFADALARVTPLERDQAAGRVRVNTADRWAGFAAAEWVFVLDPETSLLEAEAHTGRRTVLTLARGLSEQPLADRPGRVVGVGVTANRVVEVGCGPDTTSAAAESVAGWLRRVGFVPVALTAGEVPVGDRVRAAVWDEAVRLVADGVSIPTVDAAAKDIGPPPLAAMDRLGLEAVAVVVPAVRPLLAAGLTGKPDGFYHRPADNPAGPNVFAQMTLWDHAQQHGRVPGPVHHVPSTRDAADRLAMRAVNAAAACLADERYAGPAEIDAAAGLGGPVLMSSGGPLRWADARGLRELCRAMRRLGGRFAPHPELARRAAAGERFYAAGDGVRARRAA